jgi:hypothetical protein
MKDCKCIILFYNIIYKWEKESMQKKKNLDDEVLLFFLLIS